MDDVYRPKYGEQILGSEKSFSSARKQTFGHEFSNFGTLLGEGRNTIMDHVVREFPSLDIPKK